MKPRADEDDIEDPPPEAMAGNVSTGGHDELAEGLLGLSAEVLKLVVLLKEASEDEFKAVAPRLALFRSLVSQIPTKASPGKRLGFKHPPVSKPKKGKK